MQHGTQSSAASAAPAPRSAEVTRRVLLGTFATSSEAAAQYYERAQRVRRVVAAEFAEAFGRVDVLLTPTGAGLAAAILSEPNLFTALLAASCGLSA